MYYDELLVAAEKDISARNFCNLVKAGVMAYKEEKRKGKSKIYNKENTLSEKEEEISDKSFFHHVPRRTRYWSKKVVPQHENLNEASTSSSLADLNTEGPSSNPLPWLSSSSSSSFLAADSELENPQNPPSPSMTLLGDYEKTTNPPNPSFQSLCLAEKTSGKRRAEQERNRGASTSKKAKVATFSWEGRAEPEWLVRFVKDTEGAEGPIKLIFQKTLPETDVNPNQSRLLMPFEKLIRNDFLNPEESRTIALEDNKKNGVEVIVVDQRNETWRLTLKRREMKKKSGKGTMNYALMTGWNAMVEDNGLKKGDDISIWSFRRGGLLFFALVTPPPPYMALE